MENMVSEVGATWSLDSSAAEMVVEVRKGVKKIVSPAGPKCILRKRASTVST
jgi:hypothetical protein